MMNIQRMSRMILAMSLLVAGAFALSATNLVRFRSYEVLDAQLSRLVRYVFDMNMLTADWQRSPSEQTERQWRLRHEQLGDVLNSLKSGGRADADTVNRMLALHAEAAPLFRDLVIANGRNASPAVPSGQARPAGQLMGRMQAIYTDATRMNEWMHVEEKRLRSLEYWGGFMGLALLAIAVTVLSAWLDQRVVQPLRRFRDDTAVVGAGNLDHEVRVGVRNELGDLATAFNGMLRSLRRVIASRDELDREVRHRKLAETRLTSVLRTLERKNTELEEFAYVASHDLQEPLRKILAFGGQVVESAGGSLDPESRENMDRVFAAARRMQSLIGDLLALARVSTHAQPFAKVDLEAIAREAVADLDAAILKEKAVVDIAGIPPVEGDATQLRQLIQNLVSNAVKFHAPGTAPHVRISGSRQPDGWVRVEVADDGIGIDPRHAERIFKPFQRLHSRTDYEGSGMGLTICRKIAERHHGRIELDSSPGSGATFVVLLPETQAAGDDRDAQTGAA